MENLNDEQVVRDLAEAWRTLDAELIIRHLASEFRYDSMWVFEWLDRDGYAEYIRGKFDAIRKSGSHLDIREVPGHDAIAISQDGNEPAYYIIKIEDGKIVKGDLTAFLM